MKYFFDCGSEDEIKKRYRDLCKKLHPDVGGNKEEFINMQKQFESAIKEISQSGEDNKKYYQGFAYKQTYFHFKKEPEKTIDWYECQITHLTRTIQEMQDSYLMLSQEERRYYGLYINKCRSNEKLNIALDKKRKEIKKLKEKLKDEKQSKM